MEKFGRWPLALLGFGFFISTIYQYGFWSVFGLNVFQYFNPADVLKNFLYVCMAGINPFFLIVFLLQSFDDKFLKLGEKFDRKAVKSAFGPDDVITWGDVFKTIAKQPSVWAILATGISGCMLSLYAGKHFEEYPIELLYFFLFSLAAFIATSPTYDFIGFPTIRWTLVLFIGYSIVVSLKSGRADANKIYKGQDFFFAFNDAKQVSDFPTAYFKLIGRAGEQTVFVSSDNRAIIFLTGDQLSKLQLLHKKESEKAPTSLKVPSSH
jgi:hypothetical protein